MSGVPRARGEPLREIVREALLVASQSGVETRARALALLPDPPGRLRGEQEAVLGPPAPRGPRDGLRAPRAGSVGKRQRSASRRSCPTRRSWPSSAARGETRAARPGKADADAAAAGRICRAHDGAKIVLDRAPRLPLTPRCRRTGRDAGTRYAVETPPPLAAAAPAAGRPGPPRRPPYWSRSTTRPTSRPRTNTSVASLLGPRFIKMRTSCL